MDMLRMCLNKRVLLALGAAAVGALLFAPQLLGAALPILLLAVCPLSMLLMMKAMSGGGQQPARQPASTEPATAAELEARLKGMRAQQIAVEDQLQAHKRG